MKAVKRFEAIPPAGAWLGFDLRGIPAAELERAGFVRVGGFSPDAIRRIYGVTEFPIVTPADRVALARLGLC